MVGILGAGLRNTQTQPRAETAKRMIRELVSWEGQIGHNLRQMQKAFLVLTLRGRLLRVAFGL